MLETIEQIHTVATLVLTGLIWTIQLVHYPSFHYVDTEKFVEFEKMHTVKISIIVMPLMLVEFGAAAGLMVLSSFDVKNTVYFLIVLGIWVSTFALSVPCHKKLSLGKDSAVIRRLIRTNWIRTLLWSLKAVLVSLDLKETFQW